MTKKKLHIPTEAEVYEHLFNGKFDELEKLGVDQDQIFEASINYLKVLKGGKIPSEIEEYIDQMNGGSDDNTNK